MGSNQGQIVTLFFLLVCSWIALHQCSAMDTESETDQTAVFLVDATHVSQRQMPDNMFGVFFEEMSHAGAGGLWAELVSNRGFEGRGEHNESTLYPWGIVGEKSVNVDVSIDSSSLFHGNKNALKMEVLCGRKDDKCPTEGVGIYNPGFWGMNIEKGKWYEVTFYIRSVNPIDMQVSFMASNGLYTLSKRRFVSHTILSWTKIHFNMKAKDTDYRARFQLTSSRKSTLWFDQVSVMPADTHKGHGFRKDLFEMVQQLQPKFLRFPGGSYVEGVNLPYSLQWKQTIGPWQDRPGHYNDYWHYWTDDGMGHYEYFLLAEDLGAIPIWVFNIGISTYGGQVDPDHVGPLVQDALDGLEFALGPPDSTWGSIRASMGHPEPFDLKYVAPGNEDCFKQNYIGNYQKFYDAIRKDYPNIKIISNCDGSAELLKQPADIYDYHTFPMTADDMYFKETHRFDNSPRDGPKAFVSEYAVRGLDSGTTGSLFAALAESAFLMSLERNSDIVEFASYSPLFTHTKDRYWMPYAIFFNSAQVFGTPSYWMQQFFIESNGAIYLNSRLTSTSNLTATAILWQGEKEDEDYLRVKVVNYGKDAVNFNVIVQGLSDDETQELHIRGMNVTVLGSDDKMDENSFDDPKKVVPVKYYAANVGRDINIKLYPYTLTSIDMLRSDVNF